MLYIASDHAGFEIKTHVCEYLSALHLQFVDCGPAEYLHGDDYPDYANKVCDKIKDEDFGILICDTGIGMSIAANRHHNIRAALCSSIFDAVRAREHNNANILVFGSETNDMDTIHAMIKVFFDTPFSGEERHIQRLKKIDQII